MGGRQDDGRAAQGPHPVLHAHQGARLRRLLQGDGAAYQFLEQHRVRGCEGEHRLLPRQLHPETRPALRLDQAGGRQHPRHRMAGPARHPGNHHAVQPGQRLHLEHQQLAVQRLGRQQPEAPGLAGLHVVAAGKRARPPCRARAEGRQGLHPRQPDRRRLRQPPDRLRAPGAATAEGLRGLAGERPAQGGIGGPGGQPARLGPALRRRLEADFAGDLLGTGHGGPACAARPRAGHAGGRLHHAQLDAR